MRDNIENKILHKIIDPVINRKPEDIEKIGVDLQYSTVPIGKRDDDKWMSGEVLIKIARLMRFIDLIFEDEEIK